MRQKTAIPLALPALAVLAAVLAFAFPLAHHGHHGHHHHQQPVFNCGVIVTGRGPACTQPASLAARRGASPQPLAGVASATDSFTPDTAGVEMISRGNGYCADDFQSVVAYGAAVVAWPCSGSDHAEHWNTTVNSDGSIKIRLAYHTGWCLGDDGAHNGTMLEQCTGVVGVDWWRDGFALENKYLTSKRGSLQYLHTTSKANWLYCNGTFDGDNTRWDFA